MTLTNKNRTTIIRIFLLGGTIISMFFVPWLLVKAWILPLPDSIQEQLDQAVNHGFEGVIVYIKQADQAPQYLSSGWHNRETKLPARPDALFKIASISKLYDAVAVTKLVSKGRLSLDKTLADYLPEVSQRIENADQITLQMMLKHRSGIPNFTDAPGFWAAPTETFEQSLALIDGLPANFEPDQDYEYCNTNYLLINQIMDNELGYPNFKYIQKEVLIPLGLNQTYSSLSEVDQELLMSGYHVGYPHDLKVNDYGMHATAEDVGLFLSALNNGGIFESAEQKLYDSVYEYEHSGWVPGYQSFATYDSDSDTVVVVFYSTTDPDLYYWNLSEIINNRIAKIIKLKIDENKHV